MKFLVLLTTIACFADAVVGRTIVNRDEESPSAELINNEELVVASSLNVKPREAIRQKRQFGGFPNYSNSQALANANSHAQYQGPQGFGATSGIAGAQAFQNNGPGGGFGANAAHAGTQGFHAGPGGFGANAGFSASQNYNLPNGQNVGIAVGNTYSNTNGQGSLAQSGGITYS